MELEILEESNTAYNTQVLLKQKNGKKNILCKQQFQERKKHGDDVKIPTESKNSYLDK